MALPKPAKPQKGGKPTQTDNSFVESMRDIGGEFLSETPKEFFRQLLGIEKPKPSASGDLIEGQSIEIEQILDAQTEENKALQAQVAHERFLRLNQESYSTRQTQELKLQLQAIQEKTIQIAGELTELSQEVKIATIQNVVEPGVYHLNFFQKIMSFLEKFKKNISQANLWLASANKKAQKRRTFWGQVSKGGAQRLLSSEDYSQRSAG